MYNIAFVLYGFVSTRQLCVCACVCDDSASIDWPVELDGCLGANFCGDFCGAAVWIYCDHTVVCVHFYLFLHTHTEHLAVVLSSSISGHVCGGVVWGWLSRNTHAFPCCLFENDIEEQEALEYRRDGGEPRVCEMFISL